MLFDFDIAGIGDVVGVGEDAVAVDDETGADAAGHGLFFPWGGVVEVLPDGHEHHDGFFINLYDVFACVFCFGWRNVGHGLGLGRQRVRRRGGIVGEGQKGG